MVRSGESIPDTPLSERQRWLFAGLPFTRTRYVLSDEALHRYKGILSPVAISVALSHIRGLVVRQSVLQKWFRLSTVRVATDDPAVSELVIRNIRNSELFEEQLRCHLEEVQVQRSYVTG